MLQKPIDTNSKQTLSYAGNPIVQNPSVPGESQYRGMSHKQFQVMRSMDNKQSSPMSTEV